MNYNVLSKAFIFSIGAAIGVVVTWKLVKTKYEKIANEEIESVKEFYGRRVNENKSEDDISEEENKEDMSEYKDIAGSYRYAKCAKETNEEPIPYAPYVIPPEEFGEEGYDTVSLIYYEDGVLCDEDDNVIDDVDAIVGEDSLNHFGEYEDDSVFVRNYEMKTDYEILASAKKYSEIRKTSGE